MCANVRARGGGMVCREARESARADTSLHTVHLDFCYVLSFTEVDAERRIFIPVVGVADILVVLDAIYRLIVMLSSSSSYKHSAQCCGDGLDHDTVGIKCLYLLVAQATRRMQVDVRQVPDHGGCKGARLTIL